MSNFLDNFYGTIFSPSETFERLRANPSLYQGLLIVIFISILNTLLNFSLAGGVGSVVFLGLKVFGSAMVGFLSWLFFASFLDILASIFKQSGKIKEFLVLSAYALLPWVFIAPATLFKAGGVIGGIIGTILSLGIWFWATYLMILAIMKTYNLSPGRVLVLAIIPFLGGFLAFNWFVGFFATLYQMLKI